MPQTVAIDARDAHASEIRGWGRYTRELVGALAKRDDPWLLDFLDGGGRIEVLWEQVTLPRRLKRDGAGLIHSPNCFLPLRRPCPGVVTIHDLAFEAHPEDFAPKTGLKYRTFAKRAARSAEAVICPSEWTRRDVCERYGVAEEKVHVIPEAPALPPGDEQPPAGPYLLAVGDLRRKKNLDTLVKAYGELHEEGMPHQLLIAGSDAGEGERLKALAGSAPVAFLGYVDDAHLDALMRGADLLVHPSLYEGFGLVVLEAMVRGTPVALANATALPETAAGAAVLFDPRSREDMKRAIREGLRDAAILDERGRARAAELSWERTAAETAAIYARLLA
ncbi:MAG: glycosyltransferase family 4 protein [Thermoleophilaceae bacterium]|nr:glycosyltransferase family 4 protein [Thermoleophilaceae bacterium]